MKISDAGIRAIQDFEGFSRDRYADSAGLATIGYGHLIRPHEQIPERISQAYATGLLRQDLNVAEACVNRLVQVDLTQAQYDALVSFTFNLGCGALSKSTLLKRLNAGDYHGAAREFLKWVYAGGRKIEGLMNRRVAERAMFTGGSLYA